MLFSFCFAFTKKYDKYFIKYTKFYFPYLSWKLFKAQAITESSLIPTAVSRVGAIGLMQIMPSTAKWLKVNPKLLFDPKINIQTGIKYDKWLEKFWKEKNYYIKLYYIFASYNAGPGRIRKLDKKYKRFSKLYKKMPKETQSYIKRIFYYYLKL